MREHVERAASALLTLAAIAIAVVLVHREFFTSAAPSQSRPGHPEYLAEWHSIVPVGRLLGDSAAPVKVIEFADLECPFCRQFHQTVGDLSAKYRKEVAFVYVHLPLRNHRFARPAARAVECASTFGRFGDLLDRVYAKQDSLGLKSWMSYGIEAGIDDSVRFLRCVNDTASVPAVEAGLAMAEALRISATPTVIVNGWRYPSPPSAMELESTIEAILAGKDPFPSLARR